MSRRPARSIAERIQRIGPGLRVDRSLVYTPPASSLSEADAIAAVGAVLTDTSEIDFTFDSGVPSISATIKPGSVVVGRLAFTATDRLAGRSTVGAGAGEEIVCTAAGRAIIDDTDAAAQRTTLGLGTIATQNANGVAITGGAIDGTAIGATTRAAVSCTTLNANGAVVLGDASGDALTIAPSAVTWSNNPTHSGNHAFSGSVAVKGSSAFVLESQVKLNLSTSPQILMVNTSNTLNRKIWDTVVTTTDTVLFRAINDAGTAVKTLWQGSGGSDSITLFLVPEAVSSVFGHTASVTLGNAGKMQVVGTNDATSQSQVSRHSADASGPRIALGKSRHATAGSNTIVQSGDALGNFDFLGANGSTYTIAGRVGAIVNGTPGASNDMPGAVVISATPDGSGTPLEAARFESIASAVNGLQVINSVATVGITLGARGSDTNIDIKLVPKGSGVVSFGTHSALGAETVTGYITVKDSGGTNRKLAVVS